MKTVGELLRQGTKRLSEAGVETPRLDAQILLEAANGISRLDMMIRPEREVDDTIFEAMIEKRAARCPVAYIIGQKEFMGLTFQVSDQVLIPRPDTECLVEYALENVLANRTNPSVLDLCTGSGAIGLSIKYHRSDAAVTLSDLSEGALGIARANAQALALSVEIIHSDLFEAIDGQFDLIISNPPYIKEEVILTLQEEIRDYEPHMALSGGESGLDIYRRIAKACPAHLKAGGYVFLEVGNGQEADVRTIFEQEGLAFGAYVKDLSHAVRGVLMKNAAEAK